MSSKKFQGRLKQKVGSKLTTRTTKNCYVLINQNSDFINTVDCLSPNILSPEDF